MSRDTQPRCSRCSYYCYDLLSDRYEAGSFCGLHGRAAISDPYGPPPPLAHEPNSRGFDCRCGFWPKPCTAPRQLSLFD